MPEVNLRTPSDYQGDGRGTYPFVVEDVRAWVLRLVGRDEDITGAELFRVTALDLEDWSIEVGSLRGQIVRIFCGTRPGEGNGWQPTDLKN